jgi:hypothetical protein
VVLHDENPVPPPGYSDYTLLDTVGTGGHQEPIELDAAKGDYDVYVIVYKDGEVSEPVIINTLRGGVEGDWIWGDKPYKSYYVASTENGGSNVNAGTKEKPLATVEQALENLKKAYTASWPEKEIPGATVILDTVNVTKEILIDGDVGYPPIILSDDPGAPGTLKAQTGIGDNNKSLLRLENNARVTLEGGLSLEGLGKGAEVSIRGGYVETVRLP